MILLILPLVYEGIGLVHGIRYDFGLPALLLGSSVVLFRRLDYQYISLTKKNLMLLIFTIAFQFLDIMPLMSGLPVGRGETSSDIKLFADVLDVYKRQLCDNRRRFKGRGPQCEHPAPACEGHCDCEQR